MSFGRCFEISLPFVNSVPLVARILDMRSYGQSPEGWERRLSERLHWPSYFPILIQRSERRRSMQNESLIFAGQLGSSIDETNHEDF